MNPVFETPAAIPSKGTNIVNEAPKFDLDSYISNYTGRTRYSRFYLIGTSSTVLAVDALRAAVVEAKAGTDINRYVAAVAALRPHLKPGDRDGVEDRAWIEQRERQNQAETNRLEAELKGYKNNLIKESIRMGNEDLGSHYHAMGNLAAALKAYGRMRDYCTDAVHVASTSFRQIEVAMDQENWWLIQPAVQKIIALQLNLDDQAKAHSKTRAAMGVALMHMQSYREAAVSFLGTMPALGDKYNEVVTSNDVAVYGGLCALASMSREELQTQVLDNSTFRGFLELEPHIRRAINFFCAARYSQCLDILESYRADYLLDLHLQRHVPTLYHRIRTKSIVQYFAPFSRVTLDTMAKTFLAPTSSNPTTTATRHPIGNGSTNEPNPQIPSPSQPPPPPIEDELADLISNGTLKAKIDLEHRVLIADQSDLRQQVHRETLDSLRRFKKEAHLKLMRMEFLNAGMEIKSSSWAGADASSGGGGVGVSGPSISTGNNDSANAAGSAPSYYLETMMMASDAMGS